MLRLMSLDRTADIVIYRHDNDVALLRTSRVECMAVSISQNTLKDGGSDDLVQSRVSRWCSGLSVTFVTDAPSQPLAIFLPSSMTNEAPDCIAVIIFTNNSSPIFSGE